MVPPPDTRSYHIPVALLSQDPPIDELVQEYEDTGYSPALRDTTMILNEQLNSIGLPEYPDVLPEARLMEILVAEDGSHSIFVRYVSESRFRFASRLEPSGAKVTSGYEILVTAEDMKMVPLEQIAQLAQQATDRELRPHSVKELHAVEVLKLAFGDASPNGKLLENEGIRTACRQLYDDDVRSYLSPVVNTFVRNPAPRSAYLELDVFANSPKQLDSFLTNHAIIDTHYSIACGNCQLSQLTVDTREKAEEILSSTDRRCGRCGKVQLQVIETYAGEECITQAMQQGLWLESLAADVLTASTDLYWAGQMARQNELDVIAVLFDQIVLVECKDTSFGQNDLYVAAAKADNISADALVILTTRAVHKNVSDLATEMSKSNQERKIYILESPHASEIRSKLTAVLDELRGQCIFDWMTWSRRFAPFGLHLDI